MRLSNRLVYLPRKAFVVYIIVTVLLFVIGPIAYKYIGPKEMAYACGYMLAFLIIACYAYKLGAKKKSPIKKLYLSLGKTRVRVLDVVKLSIVYTFLLYALLLIQNMAAHGSISFSNFNFFSTMAESYTDIEFKVTLAGRLLVYTSVLKIVAIVGGVYYWNVLNKIYRGLCAALFLLIVVNNVFFVGSQKQVIDLFIYIIISFLANRIQSGKKLDRKTKITIAALVVAAIIVMGSVIAARANLWEFRYNAVASGMPIASTIKTESFVYKIIPDSLLLQMVYLSGYFTQGYRGLALCLKEPFIPTWGMGFSFKIMNDVSQWFNIPIEAIEKSYPVRMGAHYGIGAYSNWHTIFPWFASDITFFGALLVTCFFLYIWGRTWREWIETLNLWPLVLFAHLSILVLYIPCNNQLFQMRDSILATILLFVIWLLFRGSSIDRNGNKLSYRGT